jgi:ABC-type arginine transport system permease subunit
MKIKEILKITGLPIVFASLCCLSPLIFVLVGASSATFAASLSDQLYYGYRWAFRGLGLLLLIISLIIYFRGKGICTLSAAKKCRRELINTSLIALTVTVLGYIVWLYIVVHYPGVWLGIWEDY